MYYTHTHTHTHTHTRQALNLNDTSLTDKGATAVALAIAESAPGLEELEMALNEITPQGVCVCVYVCGCLYVCVSHLKVCMHVLCLC
jgi:hypothetical protein